MTYVADVGGLHRFRWSVLPRETSRGAGKRQLIADPTKPRDQQGGKGEGQIITEQTGTVHVLDMDIKGVFPLFCGQFSL